MKRAFLFLQGVCSPFFPRLARALRQDGHRVYRVNFNVGDWFTWRGLPSWNYRGDLDQLEDYLAGLYNSLGITDQILFGDCRPVHRPAIVRGKSNGIRTHVFEEGYFRPFWATLERDGVNGHSLLPRDPDWYRRVGAGLPDRGNGRPFPSPFTVRAVHDVVYHVAGISNRLWYPWYRTHAPTHAAAEYLGYLRRLPLLRFHRRRDQALIDQVIGDHVPYYVLPLQLDGDAQIRVHSRFRDMAGVLTEVLASFAAYAPAGSVLLIKNHPLDPGLSGHDRCIRMLVDRYGLQGRVRYLETGNLDLLLGRARGMVTVNSTVGSLALGMACPTLALGRPIYNLEGLTFQGGLDAFWNEGEPPDPVLFRHFRTTVIHATQVNGGFYSRRGIELLVGNCRRMLAAPHSPLERLL